MAKLTHEEILALHNAVLSASLLDSRTALLAGIDPRITGRLPTASRPGDQILIDLDTLNRIEAHGGAAEYTPPLATWLKNAHTLTIPREEAIVFMEAQNRVLAPYVGNRPASKISSPAWWDSHVHLPDEHAVFVALSDPKYNFRTLIGLAKASGLSERKVREILERHADLVRETQNTKGQVLFALAPPPDTQD